MITRVMRSNRGFVATTAGFVTCDRGLRDVTT